MKMTPPPQVSLTHRSLIFGIMILSLMLVCICFASAWFLKVDDMMGGPFSVTTENGRV